MMSSALTLNQNPFACSTPPNGLEKLEMPEGRNAQRRNVLRQPPADEFGDFQRSHPYAARVSMLTILASACSCCGVHVHGRGRCAPDGANPDGPRDATPQWPAPAANVRSRRSLTISISRANGNSNGIVANSDSASAAAASGGVTVAEETATRVQRPTDV